MNKYLGAKAIDTLFNGNLFRSRLEARWAVFFKELGIPYQYEPEGFVLDDIKYLPDFWLPSLQAFFEVKGPYTDNNGREKAEKLAHLSGFPVYLFQYIPYTEDLIELEPHAAGECYFHLGADYHYYWCRSECCGKYGIEYRGWSDRIECCEENIKKHKVYSQDHPLFLSAFDVARQARFGRGNVNG